MNEHIREKLLNNKPPVPCDLWEIVGEDPNCDFGGCHSEPHLMYVQGTYEQAVDHAFTLSRFVTWGDGGRIHAVIPIKL